MAFPRRYSPPLALHSAKRLCRAVIYLTHPIAAARDHQVLTECHPIGEGCGLFEGNGLFKKGGMFKRS